MQVLSPVRSTSVIQGALDIPYLKSVLLSELSFYEKFKVVLRHQFEPYFLRSGNLETPFGIVVLELMQITDNLVNVALKAPVGLSYEARFGTPNFLESAETHKKKLVANTLDLADLMLVQYFVRSEISGTIRFAWNSVYVAKSGRYTPVFDETTRVNGACIQHPHMLLDNTFLKGWVALEEIVHP